MAAYDSAGKVISLARSAGHGFSKAVTDGLVLLKGLGVEGDAHCGTTVKHRSRVAADPSQPNLRQVHLIAQELLEELAEKGFDVPPGGLGENVLTSGIDLLALPRDTILNIGKESQVKVTGLRNPCAQIESFRPGLLRHVVSKAGDGQLIRRAGIMGVVLAGGNVQVGDEVRAVYPPQPHLPLERV